MSLSFPVCQPIVVDGSKSFSFPVCSLVRIVSSITPGSVFPTCFRHLKQDFNSKLNLKKLAPVNDIRGVLYLVDPM